MTRSPFKELPFTELPDDIRKTVKEYIDTMTANQRYHLRKLAEHLRNKADENGINVISDADIEEIEIHAAFLALTMKDEE